MKSLAHRVARKYVMTRSGAMDDLRWGLKEAKRALEILEDVVSVWDLRGPDQASVADDYGDAAKAINAIYKLSRHINNLERSARRASKQARETARLDRKKRRLVNRVLNMEGLDGNTYFRKAQQGYAKAVDVLQDYGIELDEVVSSHLFNQSDGRFTVDIAFTNPKDIFSPIPITDSMLAISFHEMPSGRYEVIAYLS